MEAAVPVRMARDEALKAWLEYRKIPYNAPAGWLPTFYRKWWKKAAQFPVVIPACSGFGKVESLHGLRVDPDVEQKTCWPYGASARELLFATAKTREWLAGNGEPPKVLVIAEGGTDYLTGAATCKPGTQVIGYVAGSAGALRVARVRIPTSTHVVAIMDPDRAGQRYEDEIVDCLYPHPVYPTSLREIAR